jgi:hypothetical protein
MTARASSRVSDAPARCDASLQPLFPPDDVHEYIAPERWQVFRDAIRAANAHGVRCAIGGGLAVSLYTGMWRSPHDLDLLVVPADRERMIAVLQSARLADYYGREPYDRNWIYRGHRGDAVVDAIWALANGVGNVDETWVSAGPRTELGDVTVRLLPAEALIWSKLYVMQGTRCDWPDIVNLLFATGPTLDWERLIERCAANGDETLLASLLQLFVWIAPGRAHAFPELVWHRLHLSRPAQRVPLLCRDRIDRLDTRPWFSAAFLDEMSR